MTREQAIEKVAGMVFGVSAPALVDFCVEAGWLKLDEPKSAEDRAVLALWATGSNVTPRIVLKELDDAGLKIVEK